MKQITAEEGLALIEKYQHKNLKGLDPNDATSAFRILMKNHQYFYLFEASTQEPSYYGANRTHLLLDEIIPEIEKLGKHPIYYHFILLAAPDAMFMVDDFDALSDFFEANEQVEKYWIVNDRFDGEPKTISLKVVAIMDKPMTTLYLVRHGETKDNVAKIMQGQQHGELTSVGKAQIEELAITLSDIHFDAVVSSDLKRAYESAQILARQKNLKLQTTPLLRERDWGDFTGRYIPSLKGLPMPDNVEKMDDLLARARCFIKWIETNFQGQTVLAVGHGIINKAIQAVYYDKMTREIPKMKNGEYRKLCIR